MTVDPPPPPVATFGRRRWKFSWEHAEVVVTDVHEGRDGALSCEVVVNTLVPPNPGRIYGPAKLNLLSARTVKEVSNTCDSRDGTFDWGGALLQVVDGAVRRWREGDPVVPLVDVVDPGRPRFLLPPIMEGDGATVLFAPGGTGKSLFTLVVALAVATGSEQTSVLFDGPPSVVGPVLLLDWEADAVTQRRRLDRLTRGFGMGMPANILYRREVAPLHSTVDRLGEQVEHEGVVAVVVDSVGLARGGAPESAEDTIRLFGAIRELGVPALAVDHVAKAQFGAKPGERSAFGSVYTMNAARMVWALSGGRDGDELTLRTDIVKLNNGRPPQPRAWKVTFDEPDRRYLVVPANPEEVVEAAAPATIWEQVQAALASAPGRVLAVADISEVTGVSAEQVRTVLTRRTDIFHRLDDGLWALVSDRLDSPW